MTRPYCVPVVENTFDQLRFLTYRLPISSCIPAAFRPARLVVHYFVLAGRA